MIDALTNIDPGIPELPSVPSASSEPPFAPGPCAVEIGFTPGDSSSSGVKLPP